MEAEAQTAVMMMGLVVMTREHYIKWYQSKEKQGKTRVSL